MLSNANAKKTNAEKMLPRAGAEMVKYNGNTFDAKIFSFLWKILCSSFKTSKDEDADYKLMYSKL